MSYAATTKSNQAAEALRDLLIDYLNDYIDIGTLTAADYHLQNGIALRAAQVPAICIDDQGSTVIDGSCRGKNADGTVAAGYIVEEHQFNVQVWRKGRKAEDKRVEVNTWRDGIKACLEDHYSDFDGALQLSARSSDPVYDTPSDGANLWVGVVNVTVQTYGLQGETEILNTP